jgi:hypothetical protein
LSWAMHFRFSPAFGHTLRRGEPTERAQAV